MGIWEKAKVDVYVQSTIFAQDPPGGFQRYISYTFHSILLLLPLLPIVCYSLFSVLVLIMLSLVSMTFPFLCAYLTSTAFQLLLSFWTSLGKFSFTYHMPHHFWHPFICSLELRLGSWLFSLFLLLFNLTIWEEVKRSFPLGLGTYGWWTRILHFKILHQCSGYTPRGTLDSYHNSVEPDTQSAPGLPLTCFGFSPQGSYSSLPCEWGKGRKINRLRS